MAISKKRIAKYILLPEVMPRMRELFMSGFQHVPYLIAIVYGAVRLLPAGHPYLNPKNIGQYGIKHVVAQAANNLVISRKNIDQIALFCVILIGMAMVTLQIAILVVGLFSPSAIAQPFSADMPTNFAGFFVTPNAEQDLAYIMLDLIFGVQGMFESCVSTAANCVNLNGVEMFRFDEQTQGAGDGLLDSLGFPFPIHIALHQLFQFYSLGLLLVAVLITMYMIMTIIAETAQTGTAFGKRFNAVWAPVRIVMAFGLLIPIGDHGLNSAQYITLYAAKFGSSFATNGWLIFNNRLNGNIVLGGGTSEELISIPKRPDIGGLLQFLYTARVCKELYALSYGASAAGNDGIRAYMVRDPMAVPNHQEVDIFSSDYQDLINFADGDSTVYIRFGRHNVKDYPSEKGNVSPICGEVAIPLADPRDPNSAGNPPEPGAQIMQYRYFNTVLSVWEDESNIDDMAINMARRNGNIDPDPNLPLPDQEFLNFVVESLEVETQDAIDAAIDAEINQGYVIDADLLNKGWAAAGIWYNRIAEVNGVLTAAVMNTPNVVRYPAVMERVLRLKKKQDGIIDPATQFEPTLSNEQDVPKEYTDDLPKAKVLWAAYKFWQDSTLTSTTHTSPDGSELGALINALLGTDGLFSMRENRNVHPLAQLVGIGRSLVESSVRNVGISVGAAVGGAAGTFIGMQAAGENGEIIVNFAMTFALIGLTVGFLLFYVIPFLPFMYYFFAVGGYMKGLFEAMLGVSLCALAHIRIDGPGLPGQAAMNGYFLVFEIFLRPFLILCGLLASITVFGALVETLNDIWELVTLNVAGYDATADASNTDLAEYMRKPIDEFFYTVLYAIICYLMAMSSFKLCDQIPNNIMRWMGQSLRTFNDEQENPAEGLTGKATVGAQQVLGTVGGGVQKVLADTAKGKLSQGAGSGANAS